MMKSGAVWTIRKNWTAGNRTPATKALNGIKKSNNVLERFICFHNAQRNSTDYKEDLGGKDVVERPKVLHNKSFR